MADSIYFYDLETSGFDTRLSRIMQFGGQRTDLELNPIGRPTNILIKLSPDILPEPDAVMLTGITPQQTLAEGFTEVEFLKLFYEQIVVPNTTFVGYNNIRFDDEFMRFLHYRNFYDAYEWQWRDGCSRWDLLDVVRMTRALRPDGISWPVTLDGKPTNSLEQITKVNKLSHSAAHDALSDVNATIAVARLIKQHQPKLFDYLLKLRKKPQIEELILSAKPFVYTSGRYSSDYGHTTVAVLLAKRQGQDAALVYDLRYDPTPYFDMSITELIAAWQYRKDSNDPRLPVKTMKFNRAPAVAPLGVIKSSKSQKILGLDLASVSQNLKLLRSRQTEFVIKIDQAVEQLDNIRTAKDIDRYDSVTKVDTMLYDGFFDRQAKQDMTKLRNSDPQMIDNNLAETLSDDRLKQLLPLYKARNFSKYLSPSEAKDWSEYCSQRLLAGGQDSRMSKYFEKLSELSSQPQSSKSKFLLEELQLYGQSIMPVDEAD